MNETMPLDAIFSAANSAALLSWVALIAGPRSRGLSRAIGSGVVLSLCAVYCVLIQMFFFGADGGFFSLAAVQHLFKMPAVALAGWLHYLAFDLLVGLAIARRADALGISRWLQAPILATTFMFGPIGWLTFEVVRGVRERASNEPGSNDGALA